MALPPAFDERPFALQLVGMVVVPVIFGLLTGFALGWSEVVYLIMVGPIALLEAARMHEEYVTRETLAVELAYDGSESGTRTEVEGLELVVGVERR